MPGLARIIQLLCHVIKVCRNPIKHWLLKTNKIKWLSLKQNLVMSCLLHLDIFVIGFMVSAKTGHWTILVFVLVFDYWFCQTILSCQHTCELNPNGALISSQNFAVCQTQNNTQSLCTLSDILNVYAGFVFLFIVFL